MQNFASLIGQWGEFFSTTAQISGGLVGLVFVALTFKPQALGIAGEPGDRTLRRLARQTFLDFLNVMLVSLLMLVPYSELQIGASIALVGGIGFGRGLQRVVAVLAGPEARPRAEVVRLFLLSTVGNLLLVIAGLAAAIGRIDDTAFWSLVFTSMILLLVSGTRSAWMLLMHEALED